MHKIIRALGWVLLIGGVLGGIASYFVVSSQEFVLALLARVVERPFEYRTYLAILMAGGVAAFGGLIGALYFGMARLLERAENKTS